MAERRLTDWLDSYMAYTENSEPPENYKRWVGITCISAVLQRKCFMIWEGPTYPNIYTVLVGPSGKCRKGTAMRQGVDLILELGIPVAAEAITREALIRELRDVNETSIDDATGKPIAHSSLTVLSEELMVFLGFNNPALLSDLTDWYDCKPEWTYRTKNMGTDKINGVYVTLLGATTPEVILSSMPREFIGGGFASRVIFVYESQKGKIVEYPIITDEEKRLRELLFLDLQQISLLKGQFRVDESFLGIWGPWYREQSAHPPFRSFQFGGYVERRPKHVMKLSMIMSASRTDEMIITAGDFTKALGILEITEKNMANTFSGVGRSDLAEVTNRVMKTIAEYKEINMSELLRLYYTDADKETMLKIIATLTAMHYCDFAQTATDVRVIYTK